jgi:exoribonuclease-2
MKLMPGLVRGGDDARRRRRIGAVAEHHRPEAEGRDHEAAVAKSHVVHASHYNRASFLFPARSFKARGPPSMNVLFEDDGQLKAGAVLADQDASLQVEAVSGKRMKIKAGNVLLRFASPGPGDVMSEGGKLASELDPTFLWEASDEGEFGFADLAREYYGSHPSPAQSAAVAMLLHASPMHFYKKGKGRYRKAPPDALKAALASVERKAREGEQIAAWVADLVQDKLPEPLRAALPMLLYKPDKNALEWKALAAACEARKTNPLQLLDACGAVPSTHDYHFNAFIVEAFPQGTAFPPWGTLPAPPELPDSAARAFSIDDATTTEIDDAFSVRELATGNYEVGIHIACPALAMPRDGALPHRAHPVVYRCTCPGASSRCCRTKRWTRSRCAPARCSPHSRSPSRPPRGCAGSPRHAGRARSHRGEPAPERGDRRVRERASSPRDPAWTQELRVLWKLAQHLSAQRGKNDINRIDYSFDVDWSAGPDGRVSIVPRERGSPLDKLIAELMIHVNNTWGRLLADRGAAGLYRVQAAGKVKMSTRPGEHQGLGLTHYLWASSPLRRYSDLVNQRQILAALAGETPPYADNDAGLFAALAISRRPTASTRSSRTGWSTTGVCAGCCRKTSPSLRRR